MNIINEEQKEHDSFGMLSIARCNSNKINLFGSDISHSNTIKLKISKAQVNRKLYKDWFSSGQNIVEIEMSPVQFAEAITNMNTTGIPCTIRSIGTNYIESCPDYKSTKEIFRNELKEDLSEISQKIEDLSKSIEATINEKKTLNKSDKENILNGLLQLNQTLNSNIPFIAEQFDKQIDRTVNHSKAEIEAIIQNKIRTLGYEALKLNSDSFMLKD